MKLTPIQVRALAILRDHGPLTASFVGAKVWPDRKFKNAQGEGFAGGCSMGKLRTKGLVRSQYSSDGDYEGWVLTLEGKKALEVVAGQANGAAVRK